MKKYAIILLAVLLTTLVASSYGQGSKPKYEIVKLTKDQFEKMIYHPAKDGDNATYKGKVPCIVDFYADWCRPCKMLSPILQELLNEYDGKILIYKVNIDEEKALAAEYNIKSIPTLLLFPRKDRPAMIQGLMGKDELKKYIEEYMKP